MGNRAHADRWSRLDQPSAGQRRGKAGEPPSTAVGPAALAEPAMAVVGVIDPLASDPSIGLPVAVTSEGIVLVAAATVAGADDEVILIAIPICEAPMVAVAAQLGTLSLLFLP